MAVDDSYTKALLHFEGNDSSIVFVDESGKTWAVGGGAHVHAGVQKFGSSSLYLADGSSAISALNHPDFNFGSGDFTIDLWAYAASAGQGNSSTICSKNLSAASYSPISISMSNGAYTVKLHMSSTGSSWNLASNVAVGTLTQNEWGHVAVCRSGTNVYAFLNGVLGSTTDVSTTALMSNTDVFWLGGGNYSGTYFPGYFDEIRISKGIARWTAAFTPPTGAYRPRMNYLHARRDRMDMQGVSTQNSLA